MKIEKRIVSYLKNYGNTREVDLVNYGAQHSGRDSKDVKKILDRMAIEGKIFRVVHDKLSPPEVYVTLDEPLPPLEMDIGLGEGHIRFEAIEILEEAAALAEHMMREKESGKD